MYQYLFIAAILGLIIYLITRKKRVNVSTNAVNAFMEHQFSIQSFYERLQSLILGLDMPDVKISRVHYSMESIFSAKREYLRVHREDSIFDICASPFGSGSFVSYWLGEPRKTLKELTKKMAAIYIKNPDVHQIMDSFDKKTRYQYDADAVFRAWVLDCLKEAIEETKADKGLRMAAENLEATKA